MSVNNGPANQGRRPRSMRRALGACGVLLLLAIVSGLTASMGLAWVQADVRPFHVIPREKYQHAPGPITLAVRGLPPTTSSTGSGQTPSPEVKTIRVFASHIDLFVGGQRTSVIEFNATQVTLHDVVTLVNDPSWISEQAGGKFVLGTALVADSRSHLVIAAPVATHVLLLSKPSVLIGAQDNGSLVFDGVTVESDKPTVADVQHEYRPAIIANGASMDVTNSMFRYLGWDWNASYGVSWVNGATGKAVNSTFTHSFMGVYTSLSKSIQFIGCKFTHNMLYGLDPHTSSSDLTITKVIAEYNGAHGIIFSDNVTNSTITGSVSRYNGENGIMMDAFSTNNTIQGNLVEGNTGDGLVAAKSARNTYRDNTVQNNRVGVRMDTADTTSLFLGNSLVGNKAATENVQLDDSNTTKGNGGQWREDVLLRVWLIVATIFGMLVLATLFSVALHRTRKPKLALAS